MTLTQRCCCREDHLAGREVKILELVAAGQSNQQVGSRLSLSQHTVAYYLARMMRRLHVANRAELVARAYAYQILDHQSWPPRSTGRRCLTVRQATPSEGHLPARSRYDS